MTSFWSARKRSSLPLLAWEISVPVDAILLEEHVEALLALDERVAGQHVDEVLEPPPPVLDKVLLENAVILVQEGNLLQEGFLGELRNVNLGRKKLRIEFFWLRDPRVQVSATYVDNSPGLPS